MYHCIHWKRARRQLSDIIKNATLFLPTAYHRYFCFFSSNVSGFKLFQGQDDGAAISRDEIRNYI